MTHFVCNEEFEFCSKSLLHEFDMYYRGSVKWNKNKTNEYVVVNHNDPQGEYTKTVCDMVTSAYNVNKAVFRILPAISCYKWHVDPTFNQVFHIPVKTKSGCFFIVADECYPMVANGHGTLVTVGDLAHTFVNSSTEERIHLMFELKKE